MQRSIVFAVAFSASWQITLVVLAVRHPAYLLLAILHLILFENGVAVLFRTDLPDFLRRLRAAPPRELA